MTIAPNRSQELINAFGGLRVLVVGDVVLDRYVFGVVERINPEAPAPLLRVTEEKFATGGAGNAAKNAAALGAEATLISVVGNDASAADLMASAVIEGYQTVFITDTSRHTIDKKRYIVEGKQMLRVDYEECHDVNEAVAEQVIAKLTACVPDADLILVSDYAKGVITGSVAAAIMQLAVTHQVPVVADVKPSRSHYFKGATYISPNRQEGYEFLGIAKSDRDTVSDQELATRLRETFAANVFLTLSEDGMFVCTEDVVGTNVTQDHRITVADTSGCGDTAAVVLALSKLAGADDIEAAILSNAAGAVNATKIGAQAVTPDELQHMVAHGELSQQV